MTDQTFYAIEIDQHMSGRTYAIVKCLEDEDGLWHVRSIEYRQHSGRISHFRKDEAVRRMRELGLLKRGEKPTFVHAPVGVRRAGQLMRHAG